MSACRTPLLLQGPRWELEEGDAAYPRRLFDGAEHPGKLYVLGDPSALERPCAAVVGARKATPYGVACAQLAARCAVAMGIGVVSGAAIGCDQASQREALRLGGGVVAVLGSGANVVYPPSARDLLEGVVESGGAVVSLQPWDAPPQKWAFVKRNAVIAALARVLVICEAGMPSGTFSTAQSASDAGREILVFPGSVFSPNSTGSNYLIASDANAIPVWDQKCLEVAYSRNIGRLCSPRAAAGGGSGRGTPGAGALTRDERSVVEALAASAATPGALAPALGVELPRLMRLLGAFEMKGWVSRLPDGRYSLTEQALLEHNTGEMRGGSCRS